MRRIQLLVAALFMMPHTVYAIVIDFNDTVDDGDTIQPVLPYLEDGFRLRNGNTGNSNGLFDANFGDFGYSSDYFGWVGQGGFFVIEEAGAAAFALNSIDLFDLGFNNMLDFSIVGFLTGGGTVAFDGSTMNPTTFLFDNAWSNLSRVEVMSNSSSGAADNIDVTTVPEPGTLALLGIGLAGLGLRRRLKQA